MERIEAAYGRVAEDHTYSKEEGQYRARATLVRVVKEWKSLAILRWVSCPSLRRGTSHTDVSILD